MAYTQLVLFSCMLLLVLSSITADPVGYSCTGPSGVPYTTNSTRYLANLNLLLSSLSSNANATSHPKFYNTTIGGNGSDKVYGLFLCRGDITPKDCQDCIASAGAEIKPLCPNATTAIAWYDTCMIRYSNESIFSILQQDPVIYPYGPKNITNLKQYNKTVGDLMHGLVKQAVSGSTTPKYHAAGDVIYYTSFDTVYGLVQCTPDITSDECNSCLTGSINIDIPNKLYPREGGRVLKPSCNLRYEFNSAFYKTTPAALPPTTNSTVTEKGRNISTRSIIVLVVVSVAIVITIIMIIIFYLRLRRTKQKLNVEDEDDQNESLQVNFDTIKAATNDFSDENKIGEGGFGAVYKGMLLDGQMIAVKRLSKNSGQGEIEFKNEVQLVAKLQHRNLVRILGFCLKGEEKLLIYEFVPNNSLNHFIFDPIKRSHLDWAQRYKIIEGIARGLLYLHEDSRLKIIHRDLKASNVLLDGEMNVKIADFGMARLFVADQTQSNTNRIVGTYGYMAPEYIMQGQVSVKTDVFSFGILLLEIVSGQRNNNVDQSWSTECGLLDYAWRKWTEGAASSLIDPNLGENYDRSEVTRCIHIGLLCAQANASNRPTMATVVQKLNSYSESLPLPSAAAFVMGSEIQFGEFSTDGSRVTKSDQSELKSINEMSITDFSGR